MVSGLRQCRLSTVLCALVALASPAAVDAAENIEITRLWTGFREARSFLRLSELFTGKENPGKSTIIRSQPDERAGFYYTIRLVDEDRGELPDGTIVVQVIAPDGEVPATYQFPFRAGAKRKVRLDVGITGKDWPYGETLPLAWKLDVLDESGSIIASRQSFLWSKPPAENS